MIAAIIAISRDEDLKMASISIFVFLFAFIISTDLNSAYTVKAETEIVTNIAAKIS